MNNELKKNLKIIKLTGLMFNGHSIAEWLRDGSGKHGEDLRAALCWTCNEQPELLMNKGFQPATPK